MSETNDGAGNRLVALVHIGHQQGEQRIGLGQILGISVLGRSIVNGQLVDQRTAVCNLGLGGGVLLSCFAASVDGGQVLVGSFEEADSFGVVVGLPELELGSTLEEFADALRLLDTRQLNQDTLRSAQLLDGRLGNTELIDTLADNLVGAVVGIGSLGADGLDNVVVVVTHLDFVAEVAAAEDGSQRDIGVEGDNLLVEQGDKVAVGGHLLLGQGIVDSLDEGGVLGIGGGQGTHNIDRRDLEHHVHTALQIKTEVNFATLTLAVGVAEINLLSSHGVKVVSFAGSHQRVRENLGINLSIASAGNQFLHLLTAYVVFGISFGFALNNICHNCKRQLEQTYQSKSPS